MNSRLLKEVCHIDAAGENLLRAAMKNLHLSARAHEWILKVSRTIADLALSEVIKPEHLTGAMQYRSLETEQRVRSSSDPHWRSSQAGGPSFQARSSSTKK